MSTVRRGLQSIPVKIVGASPRAEGPPPVRRYTPGPASAPDHTPDHAHEHAHAPEAAGPRSLGQAAPCLLFVADTAISEADIAREMQYHRADTPRASRAAAARALMVRELLRLEVERLGLASTVEPIGNETAEEAHIRALLEDAIEARTPDEDACRHYFEHNRERFRSPDRRRLRHILLAAAPDDVSARLDARARAGQLIASLQANPAQFADFAHRYSGCPSKDNGGELGWLQRGQTTPEFDRQVFRLPPGLASFPVESRWGYHVVHVDALEAGEPLAFDAVKTHIAAQLELQVHQREIQHYLQGLQARFGVRGLEHFDP